MKVKLHLIAAGLMSVFVIAVWQFPQAWYTSTDAQLKQIWFSGLTNLTGWSYQEIPLAKSAEAILVADRLLSGQFTNTMGQAIQVFSAKRYVESQNEIGLFVHTPDRCWTENGWKMEAISPDCLELKVHGLPVVFERRVFAYGSHRELVYFGGMVGGQPLPYRLDHNMSVGMKHQIGKALDKTGSGYRATDSRLWRRVWDSFVSRRPLIGPKQFIRISTPLTVAGVEKADLLMQNFLEQWLVAVDYQVELAEWMKQKI